MNILGFSGLHHAKAFKRKEFAGLTDREYRIVQGADSAAALVSDLGIVAAAAEERFTREKHTGAFPANAMRYCLSQASLSMDAVDAVAHSFAYQRDRFAEGDELAVRAYEEVFSREVQLAVLRDHFGLPELPDRLVSVPHHLAHAASAYYPSGFENALILVTDGLGEWQSATVALGHGGEIDVLTEIPAISSLGLLYGAFTLYLGFEFGRDEFKVMGLAPYGGARHYFDTIMSELVHLGPAGSYTVPALLANASPRERETYSGTLRLLAELFGPPRQPGEEITQRHMDVAAGLQNALEACQLHLLRHHRQETGSNDLCMAGGVALNCVANGLVERSRLFRNIFVQPAAGDDGAALGAALHVHRERSRWDKPGRMGLPFWGPEFTETEIRETLKDCKDLVSFRRLISLVDVAARLAAGEIAGWFHGRMEFGPRALGNRSILADPQDPGMRDRVNALVKKREAFRPFAPVVTREAAHVFFELEPGHEETFENMLFTTRVRHPYRAKLPATTHVDGSARVQCVAQEQHPRLWALLTAFAELSEMPILLNTSFNVGGQPIVCTPREAVETFIDAGLDLLVIGDFLVERRSVS